MARLSQYLLPIFQLEVSLGNEVERIDEPAGTECPYAVIFKRPLHKKEIEDEIHLAASVKYWESHDCHYETGAGYYCEVTKHSISGPSK